MHLKRAWRRPPLTLRTEPWTPSLTPPPLLHSPLSLAALPTPHPSPLNSRHARILQRSGCPALAGSWIQSSRLVGQIRFQGSLPAAGPEAGDDDGQGEANQGPLAALKGDLGVQDMPAGHIWKGRRGSGKGVGWQGVGGRGRRGKVVVRWPFPAGRRAARR